MRSPPSPVVGRLEACLRRHDEELRAGLRAALVERTFPTHARHRSTPPSIDAERDAVRAVRVLYTHGSIACFVAGMSRAAAWKCGARRLLAAGAFLEATMTEWEDAFEGAEEDDTLESLQTDLVEAWVRAAWSEVRACAPDLRGFVSEHDTIWMTDLDTGAKVAAEDVGLGWL
jgi:hypothetical protein